MGLFHDCKKYFDTDNLYLVLSVSEKATEEELKRAYKKRSLLLHPDRVTDDKRKEATTMFQILSKVYSILSDEEQRKIYNETGEIDEENTVSKHKDWSVYWRLLFPKLTLLDINTFMDAYRGSDEERSDLKKYYIQYRGDMSQMNAHVIGYQQTEETRYRQILAEMIEKGEIPRFSTCGKESDIKQYSKEKKEKEPKLLREKTECSEDFVTIMANRRDVRKQQFYQMISSIEKKYCKKPVPMYECELPNLQADEFEKTHLFLSEKEPKLLRKKTKCSEDFVTIMANRQDIRKQQFCKMISSIEKKYCKKPVPMYECELPNLQAYEFEKTHIFLSNENKDERIKMSVEYRNDEMESFWPKNLRAKRKQQFNELIFELERKYCKKLRCRRRKKIGPAYNS